MCGRGACSLDPEALKRVCNVSHFVNSHHYSPSYNICPSTFIPVLLLQSQLHQYYVLNNTDTATTSTGDDSQTEDTSKTPEDAQILSAMRWGLVPSFSKNGKMTFNTINARQDTVCSKPMYRRLVNRKRCVVLMNGYYEWKTQGKDKQPYFFTPKYRADANGKKSDHDVAAQLALDPPLMYMAALWDVWRSKEDPLAPPLFTVTVITTASSDDVSFCHHRMPLLMTRECASRWVDVDRYSIEQCFGMIAESQSRITIRNKAVPRKIVGNVRNKGIECIQSVEEKESKVRKGGLHRFFESAKSTKKTKREMDGNVVGDSKGKGSGSGMDIDSQTEDDTDHGVMDQEMKEAVAASKKSYAEEQKRGQKRRLETENGNSLIAAKRQKLNDRNTK